MNMTDITPFTLRSQGGLILSFALNCGLKIQAVRPGFYEDWRIVDHMGRKTRVSYESTPEMVSEYVRGIFHESLREAIASL